VGCSTGLGQGGAGNARLKLRKVSAPVGAGFKDRALRPRPRKHGLKQSLGDEIFPWSEPQWNADRRAGAQRPLPREADRFAQTA